MAFTLAQLETRTRFPGVGYTSSISNVLDTSTITLNLKEGP